MQVSPNSAAARLGAIRIGNQTLTLLQRSGASMFQDVPLSSPYADYVSLMQQYGITAGCSANPPRYCPADTLTRGQMAVFITTALNKASGIPLAYHGVPYFQDVDQKHLFFAAVQRIKELGITAGCSAAPPRYCWDEKIQQGQMAVFTIRGWQIGTDTPALDFPAQQIFTDVSPGHLFYAHIQKMQALGIWNGCGSNRYCPDDSVTREQAALLIMRGFFGAP
jgi:hypothetical protein